MNLGELLDEAYDRADDSRDEPKVSVARMIRYANEAILEACERAPLLYDSESAFCQIPLAIGTADYSIDASIRRIDKMILDSDSSLLIQETQEALIRRYGTPWEDHDGTPKHYVRNDRRLRIYPIPDADDTIRMMVYRRPLANERLDSEDDIPVIPEQYHRDLVYWMLWRYFETLDADVGRPDIADKNLALFDARFGPRKTARYDAFARNSPGGSALPVIGVR